MTTLMTPERLPLDHAGDRRRRIVRAARSAGERTLHLVDIDNLLGDPRTTDATQIDRVVAAYKRAADHRPGDHVMVATSPSRMHAVEIGLAWPGVTHRWRRGTDGADMVLLEAATEAAESRRYERVVLGSGDRIFLEAQDQLRAADIDVAVVSRRRALAWTLAVRSGNVRYLDDFLEGPPNEASAVDRLRRAS